jgi:glycosyltransferase involved in cell wall biosynthesis
LVAAALALGTALPLPSAGEVEAISLRHVSREMRVWESDHGMPTGRPGSLVQTRDGYLWISVQGYLSRFNGHRFETFLAGEVLGPRSRFIISFALGGDGTIWMRSALGSLSRYRDGEFSAIEIPSEFGQVFSLCGRPDEGALVFCRNPDERTCHLLSVSGEGSPEVLLSLPRLVPASVQHSRDGRIWFLVPGVALSEVTGGELQPVPGESPPPEVFLCHPDGSLGAVDSTGLSRYDENAGGWSREREFSTRAPRPDVVVASSPSLPAAASAAALARARGARFVLEVRDLWPDSAIAMGLVSDPRIIAVSRRLESYCYRRADRIVALTEGIRDGIVAQGVSPARITLITNGVDLEIQDDTAPVALPDDAFVAMYVGAHGTYSSLETVLDAAERLRDTPQARVVLVGGGDRKAALVEGAARRGLANVTFIDSVPKREVPSWLARADVCLLPYQDNPLFAGALPNKVFDYLGAARPIIAAAPEGELTRLVAAAGCGVAVPPEDGAALAAAIREMATDRDAARRLGDNGRRHALEHYDRAALAARFVAVVESLA